MLDADWIHAACERAYARYPDVTGTHDFREWLLAQVGDATSRHVDDMLIAWGCARGDVAALSILELHTLPVVRSSLARTLSAEQLDEALQELRVQMLVAATSQASIAKYDGRAPLSVWLRVCALRLALRHRRRPHSVEIGDDELLDRVSAGVPEPQLIYMRATYGRQFQAAFIEAVRALSPRHRNLLRHSVIDGLSIDQIGPIYHIHRATAARQLADARTALVAATRANLQAALGVADEELDSILRVLVSHSIASFGGMWAKATEAR